MIPVRVSIKNYLVPYLDSVGTELGTDDYSEIVNHLLRESRRRGASGSPAEPSRPNDDDDSIADSLLEFMPA